MGDYDIAEQVRLVAAVGYVTQSDLDMLGDAADEIERLRIALSCAKSAVAQIVVAPSCPELFAEVERLRRINAEQNAVIDQWEAAWEAAGQPGQLGRMKSDGMLDEIKQLRAEVARLSVDENTRRRAARRAAASYPHACSTGFAPCWCEADA